MSESTIGDFIQDFHGVRYQTVDVGRAVAFDPDGNPIELFEPARSRS